jgi:hypothetical protein
VAGNREEEIIVEWWQLGQLILQHLRCRFSTLTFLLDPGLGCFGEDLVRQLSQPVFEQRADNIGIIEIVVCD